MKKILNTTLLLLFLSLFWLSGISSGSPATYQITEAELTQLETNLSKQENQLKMLKGELNLLNLDSTEAKQQLIIASQQLTIALDELSQSKTELQLLKQDLRKSKEGLEKANLYLDQYEKEQNKTKSRLKRQRNLYMVVSILVGGFALSK